MELKNKDIYSLSASEISDNWLDEIEKEYDEKAENSTVDEFMEFGNFIKSTPFYKSLDDEYSRLREKMWKIRSYQSSIEYIELYSLIGHYYRYSIFSDADLSECEYVYVYSVFPSEGGVIIRCFHFYDEFYRLNDLEGCKVDIMRDIEIDSEANFKEELKKFHEISKDDFINAFKKLHDKMLDEFNWSVDEVESLAERNKQE